MQSIANLEQSILLHLRELPRDKQQEVLDFVEFLSQKTAKAAPEKLSLQAIAALPLEERHQHFQSLIPAMADDFANDPEMTEFDSLDTEDWDIAND